jgi:Uma2 family endonuclease
MMTSTASIIEILSPRQEVDPYRYGWRYVHHPQPDGSTTVEQVPLTLEDVLHPEEGDHVTHSRDHERFRVYLVDVLERQIAGQPGAVVLNDVRVKWDVAGLRPHGPDIAVVFDVREQRNWSTFDVAEEGVRPALIIEITSPETRILDLYEKIEEYDQAGVPLYIIVDTYTRRGTMSRRIWAYRHNGNGYMVLPPDERGWIWLDPISIWIGMRNNQVECYDQDGQMIGITSASTPRVRRRRCGC